MGQAKKQQMEEEFRKQDAMRRQLEGFAKSGKAAGTCWQCQAPLTKNEVDSDFCPHCQGNLHMKDDD